MAKLSPSPLGAVVSPSGVRRTWVDLLGFAAAYLLSAYVARIASGLVQNFSCFWLPSGLFVATLLRQDSRAWPRFLAAGFGANFLFDVMDGNTPSIGLLFATGTVMEAWLGAWLVRRFVAARPDLSTVREVVGLAVCTALVATPACAALGTLGLGWLTGGSASLQSWVLWWSSNLLGVLLLAPLLLAWDSAANWNWRGSSGGKKLEVTALLVAVVVLAIFCFYDAPPGGSPRKYLLVPCVLWLALRFDLRLTALGLLVGSFTAAWLTAQDWSGPTHGLAAAEDHARLIDLNLFLGVAALTALVVSASASQRKRAMANLTASEARARRMFDASPVPCALNDEQQNIIGLNRAFTRTFGYDLPDIPTLAAWWPKAFPDADYRQLVAESWQTRLVNSQQTGVPLEPMELVICAKNGTRLTAIVGSTFIEESSSRINLITLFDITGRKEAEAALQNRTAFLEAMVDSPVDGILVTDRQGHKLYQNRRTAELWKIPQAIADDKDDRKQLAFVSGCTRDPPGFVERVAFLNAQPKELSHDEIELIDGLVLERSTSPVLAKDGEVIGRIWTFRDITARKQREEEQRLTGAAIKAITQGVVVAGLDALIISVNDAFQSITGYRSDEILGRNCRFLQGPGSDPQTVAAIRGALLTRTLFAGEILNYRKDGSPFWNDLTISPVKNTQGAVTHFVGVTRDVTIRCQAEQALRESELQLRLVIRGGNLGFWDWNAVTGRLVVNDRWLEMLGLPAEGFAPSIEHWHSLVHPEDRPKLDRLLREVIQNPADRDLEVEVRARHRDGHYLWILDKASVVARAADGSPLRIVGTHLDITARMTAEVALRESEARYRRVLLGTSEGMWEWNLQTGKEYCSPRWLELLGYDSTDTVPDFESFTALIHPDDVAHVLATSDEAIRDRKPFKSEMRLRRKDGSYLWVLSRAIVDYDPAGEPLSMTGSIADLTATREIEQQLRQSQKLQAVGTLAGGIAHDFNNILAGIYGYTSLARQAAGGNAELLDYLGEIGRAGRRAAELVQQILAFSRTRGGDDNLEPVPLNRIVNEAAKLLRAASPSTVTFDLQVEQDLPSVLGNPAQLHQVVMNLGTNAVHAVRDQPNAQLSLRVDTCTIDEALARTLPGLAAGPWVRLTVRDTGHGMDPETQARVFEPFFTTKGPGEGTGLGLSVAHGIVRNHHGAIRLTSEVGRGTTFEVFLPASTSASIEVNPEPAASARGQGERILLIDDEALIVFSGKLALTQLGYQAVGETSVLAALGLLERDPQAFDLVISDQTMPAMTGLELAERLHKLRPDLPVVIASGHTGVLTPERIKAAGVREILAKPYLLSQLAAVIRRQLAPRP